MCPAATGSSRFSSVPRVFWGDICAQPAGFPGSPFQPSEVEDHCLRRPWPAAAGAGQAGMAHCPSRVRESLAELCPLIPGMDPSSHGQSTHPGTDLAASRVLGAGASAMSAHGRILQPPGQSRRPEAARGSEPCLPACLPACRPLGNARAKLHMLGAFLLGFVDEERGFRGEKGPAHHHTAGTRSRQDWNQGLASATPLKSAPPCLGPAPPPIGRRAPQSQ